jgi:hypothetical protein
LEPLEETSTDGFDDLVAITIQVDWEYNSGYEGGVNREDYSDTEYQPRSSSDNSQWDAEILDKLSGDELESNLWQQYELLAEVAALTVPTPYTQIAAPQMKDQWAKVEQNTALGYVGNLIHSKEWKVQDAHDWEEFQLLNEWIINRKDPQISMICAIFTPKPALESHQQSSNSHTAPLKSQTETKETFAEQVWF